MPITLIRVVNEQTINRSILLDKLDDGQANTERYAQLPKQRVYVPYWNDHRDSKGDLIDPSVKGYVDLVPSDRVLLSADRGTIAGMALPWNVHGFVNSGVITTFAFSSTLIATAVVATAVHSAAPNKVTIGGTTFFSVSPDKTYVVFENTTGGVQTVPSSAFTSFSTTSIVVPDTAVTIGTPGAGWKVTVKANSKLSNQFTL